MVLKLLGLCRNKKALPEANCWVRIVTIEILYDFPAFHFEIIIVKRMFKVHALRFLQLMIVVVANDGFQRGSPTPVTVCSESIAVWYVHRCYSPTQPVF